MQNGFVKNHDLLNEDYRVEDLLDFSSMISLFTGMLSRVKRHSIIGVVGGYGTGKSTMLYQLEKNDQNNWFVFDAWAFPNRKDLWEGFVLDFAKKISPKEFSLARKKIDGTQSDDLKSLNGIVAEGANLFLPGANIVKNFSSLFKSSPARRVFEFREMFLRLIEKHNADLFVVLEDVDRAGHEGMVFLETLKQFIAKELSVYTKHKVIFIVPVGTKNYEMPEYLDSYRKTLDYKFDFEPDVNFERFVNEVFIDVSDRFKSQSNWKDHLIQLCRFFVGTGKTIRDLKAVLRSANQSYLNQESIDNFTPDPRITILIEMHDFLKGRYSMNSLKNDVRQIQMIVRNGERFYGQFMLALQRDAKFVSVKDISGHGIPEIVFTKNYNFSFPESWKDSYDPRNWFRLSDRYLKKSITEV